MRKQSFTCLPLLVLPTFVASRVFSAQLTPPPTCEKGNLGTNALSLMVVGFLSSGKM